MEHPPIDYSRKWYVMAAIAMSIFLSTIDESIVNVALPTLVRDLNTTFALVQWVVLAYLLTQTVLMLSIGRLGDMIGKKPIYTTGFIIFTLSSVLCGLAPSIYWLIACRILQAIGAAMVLALGFAITTEAFPPNERGKALGLISTIVSVGVVVGPTIGGLIIDLLSWRWIFFVNLPIGIIGTFMAFRFIPSFKPTGRQKFDYAGAVTFLISLLALLSALSLGQQAGFGSPAILFLFTGWVIFLITFVVVEQRTGQPMIDLRLFQKQVFNVDVIVRVISFVTMAGTIILLPFYLENILGYTTRQVGLLLVVIPMAVGFISPISGTLSDRFGSHLIALVGLGLLLSGYYALSSLSAETTTPGYILRLLLLGFGLGIFQAPNNSAIMGSAPPERLGVISGLLSISRTLGQTVGIALIGALWTGRTAYHAGGLLAGGVTTASKAAQMAGLQDTFLAALGLMMLALILSIWSFVQERRLLQPTSVQRIHEATPRKAKEKIKT